uniref:Secreted protein n=1 Tax=Bartonella rochalimae ATCC BAA-1498 TaxID=685782 RepID=E6YMF9_9HYPH|nr:hypothetical protein BARRO_50410 [Bartonella rochalimae ATCC BAA-1498]
MKLSMFSLIFALSFLCLKFDHTARFVSAMWNYQKTIKSLSMVRFCRFKRMSNHKTISKLHYFVEAFSPNPFKTSSNSNLSTSLRGLAFPLSQLLITALRTKLALDKSSFSKAWHSFTSS